MGTCANNNILIRKITLTEKPCIYIGGPYEEKFASKKVNQNKEAVKKSKDYFEQLPCRTQTYDGCPIYLVKLRNILI